MARRIFWGIFLVCAAALVLLNQLNLFITINIWSLLFTIVLVAIIVESIFHKSFFGIFLPLAGLAIIYAEPLGIAAITPWPVLIAAVFLTAGFSVLFKKSWHVSSRGKDQHEFVSDTDGSLGGDVINARVSMGEGRKYIHSDNLKRVNLSCSLGEMKVYFDKAQLSPDGAVIDVNCSLGSVSLFVPRQWRIESDLSVSLGEVDNRDQGSENEAVVRLVGSVSLGNVEVIYM